MITVTGKIIGVEAVTRELATAAPKRAVTRLRRTVRALGLTLQRNVVLEKLQGGVLNKRSGRLARSINTRFTDTDASSTSTTGTALIYGRAWELGFTVPARDIFPKRAGALFWPGAAHPVRKVHQNARTEAPRSFLRSALEELRPQILRDLSAAMEGLGGGV